MKAGSIFDNILVTDDPAYAKQFAQETWGKIKEVRSFAYIITYMIVRSFIFTKVFTPKPALRLHF